jgi:purine-binding chemotaxis protein CheW
MTSRLLFSIGAATYAVNTSSVYEVVPRPALIPIAGAPPRVAGLFDRSGLEMPVVDLTPGTAGPPRAPAHSDALVVWSEHGHWVALLAEQVHDVHDSAAAEEPLPESMAAGGLDIAHSVVRVDGQLVLLPDEEQLIGLAEATDALLDLRDDAAPHDTDDEEEDDVFAQRARSLAEADGAVDEPELDLQLVVARLGGETFCLPVTAVREFCRAPHIAPIPCCPPHILGSVNLRGDIITVVDLSAVLNVPPVVVGEEWTLAILESSGITAAVAVDEALTVIAMDAADIEPLPEMVAAAARLYLMGMVHTPHGVGTVIDFEAILSGDVLVVDEGV